MLTTESIKALTRKIMADAQAGVEHRGFTHGQQLHFESTSTIFAAGDTYTYPVVIDAVVYDGPGRMVKGKRQVGQYLRGTGRLGTAWFRFDRLHVGLVERLRAGGVAPLYAKPDGEARSMYLGDLGGIREA